MQLPKTEFKSVMPVILARDEVSGLRETVEALATLLPPADVEKIVMYLAPDSTEECKAAAKELENTIKTVPVRYVQQQTIVGIEEFQEYMLKKSTASHALFLSADLEVEPETAVRMLEACKQNPNALVSLTRWGKGGGFSGYPKWQLPLHWFFQKVVRIMYGARMSTDATAGYAAFPTKIAAGLWLREKRQSMFLEYKLNLLCLKMPLIELPVRYRARREGKSTGSFMHKVRYLVPLICVRFTPRNKLFRFQEK